MRGVRSIADQCDVVKGPALIADAQEPLPRRSRLVSGVVEERLPLEPRCEELFGRGNGLDGIVPIEAGVFPRGLIAFDNKGRELAIELVAMRLEDTVLILDEKKRKRVQRQA